MANAGWQMSDGRWRITDGRWQMTNARWRMANSRWRMSSARWRRVAAMKGRAASRWQKSAWVPSWETIPIVSLRIRRTTRSESCPTRVLDAADRPGQGDGVGQSLHGDVKTPQKSPNEAIYERAVVKRGGADFVSRAPAHPLRRRLRSIWPISDLSADELVVQPATHPLSPRPREIAPPRYRQCAKR